MNEQLKRTALAYDAFLWWLDCGSAAGPHSVRQIQRCAEELMQAHAMTREALRAEPYVPYRPSPALAALDCAHDQSTRGCVEDLAASGGMLAGRYCDGCGARVSPKGAPMQSSPSVERMVARVSLEVQIGFARNNLIDWAARVTLGETIDGDEAGSVKADPIRDHACLQVDRWTAILASLEELKRLRSVDHLPAITN